MDNDYKIIIGLGTGRVGSKSLSTLFNNQEGCQFTHESFRLPWDFDFLRINHALGSLFGRLCTDHRVLTTGDIAPWYLPYVEYIQKRYPDIFKFVCLIRDKEEVIKSFLYKVPNGNHWTNPNSEFFENGTKVSVFDECFPKFNLPKEDAICKYYESYYAKAYELEKRFSNFKIFDINYLNSEDKQKKIFNFIGFENNKINTRIYLNYGHSDKLRLWVYWHNCSSIPPYINLCFETMKRNIGNGFKLTFLDSRNLSEFLPNINPKVDKLIFDKTGKSHPCIKADYIRVKLLEKYGGLWLDIDTIVMKNLSRIKNLLRSHDYVGRINTEQYVSIGIMASKKNGELITLYSKEMDKYLENNDSLSSASIWGSRMLTTLANKIDSSKLKFLPNKEISPINFKSWKKFLSDDYEPNDFIDGGTICVLLYNRMFSGKIRSMTKDQMLNGKTLLSKLLRKALNL